jgi:hypothetical protein
VLNLNAEAGTRGDDAVVHDAPERVVAAVDLRGPVSDGDDADVLALHTGAARRVGLRRAAVDGGTEGEGRRERERCAQHDGVVVVAGG